MTVGTDGDIAGMVGGFTYFIIAKPVPTVTAASPNSGTKTGGTTVNIIGTGFYGGGVSSAVTAVTFGGASATNISVISDTSLTVVTPVGIPGSANIVVTTSVGSSSSFSGFTYTTPTSPAIAIPL